MQHAGRERSGRRVEGHGTAALLDRYGDDDGLAGFYLLAGVRRDLVPTAGGLPDAVRADAAAAASAA